MLKVLTGKTVRSPISLARLSASRFCALDYLFKEFYKNLSDRHPTQTHCTLLYLRQL